jgi:predicted small lipoprotein YifL
MPTMRSRILRLVLLAGLTTASGCASKIPVQQFPPAADLRVEPAPVLDPAALNSDKALNAYQAERDAWGEAGWLQVARVCRWARDMGAKVECPK